MRQFQFAQYLPYSCERCLTQKGSPNLRSPSQSAPHPFDAFVPIQPTDRRLVNECRARAIPSLARRTILRPARCSLLSVSASRCQHRPARSSVHSGEAVNSGTADEDAPSLWTIARRSPPLTEAGSGQPPGFSVVLLLRRRAPRSAQPRKAEWRTTVASRIQKCEDRSTTIGRVAMRERKARIAGASSITSGGRPSGSAMTLPARDVGIAETASSLITDARSLNIRSCASSLITASRCARSVIWQCTG